MDHLKKLFRLKSLFGLEGKKEKKKAPSEEEVLAVRLRPFQRWLYKSQDIVTWEDPAESAFALLLVNILFWFLSYLQWRVYGVIFTVVCMLVAHEAWVEHIWPEISVNPSAGDQNVAETQPEKPPHSGLLTVPEISHYATGIRAAVSVQYAKLRYLRATQPPLYCAIVSAGCLFTAGVGTVFSGMALIYLSTMTLMVAPGVVKHVLPPQWKRSILSIFTYISSLLVPPEGNMEDYMPETNKENLLLLNQAGENYDLSTPTTEDSSLADLMIPGHDESSVDTLDSLVLPSIPQALESSDSDSEEGALRFKSEHFNNAEKHSSSDEESSLVKDLNFPDVPPPTGIKDVVTSVLYKTFPKAFSSAQYQAEPLQQAEDSDSDFEIIDNGDAS
ncbi:reticulophagy regulator 3-like isoform X2 [Cimex lectularius]|uniref:Reticulon domain-containing protein n=1 Tax=Cimex lectularius TaxID=79782 RepID=A0A8I6RFD2_CIMLE|nr:reticulophagy regulator 3-like isoform X2 [Cimex lectularius]